MSPNTQGVLASFSVSVIVLLGGAFFWVMRFGGVLPIEACLDTAKGLSCSGIGTWLAYELIMWPLIGGYWLVQLARWASRKGLIVVESRS